MEVLCLSAPRSGSTSAGEALKILGYHPFAGMAHNYFKDNRFTIWDEAINASYNGKGPRFTNDDFEKFLGPYDSVSGWSPAILAEDLINAYPDAKVILTTRDPEKWLESWNSTIVSTQRWWWKWNWILPICGGLIRDFRRNTSISFDAWSYGDPFDRDQQRRIYLDHNAKIRALVPKDRLLEMDAHGSWEPLCKFLGKGVPNEPYPHGARRDGFHVVMAMIWRQALLRALRRMVIGGGLGVMVVVLVLRYSRRMRRST